MDWIRRTPDGAAEIEKNFLANVKYDFYFFVVVYQYNANVFKLNVNYRLHG